MSGKKDCVSQYSRRELGRLALAVVPAAGLMTRPESLLGQAKPNSTWGGVPVGFFRRIGLAPKQLILRVPSRLW